MDEYFKFLDKLRESGVVNMFGAGPYLELEFDFTMKEAKKILLDWMEQYGEK